MPVYSSIKDWIQSKVVKPFKQYLREGAAPSLLAWSASVGFVAGLCPLLGVSTLLALFMHFALKLCNVKLHLPMLLLANFVSIPIEVACILPFMRLGEFVMGAQRLDAAPVAIKDILFNNPGSALKGIGQALIGWLIASPVITVVLAQTLKPIFTWAVQKYSKHRTTDDVHEVMLSQGVSDDIETDHNSSRTALREDSSPHAAQAISRRSSSSPSK